MFDAIVHRPSPARRRAAFLTASVALHGAVAVAIVAAGMWRVDKISPPRPPMFALAPVAPPAPPEPPKSEPTPPELTPGPAARPAAVSAAPSLVDPDDLIVDETAPANARIGAGPIGGGGDGGTATLGGDGTCVGVECLPNIAVPEVPEPPELPDPPVVPEAELEGTRLSGNDQIQPPDSVRHAMMRAGTTRLHAAIRLCLSKRGAPTSVSVVASTGHRAYDARFVAEMYNWRYRPYRPEGRAVPVCTVVHFDYVQR